MRTGLGAAWGLGMLALGAALICRAQTPVGAHPGAEALLSSGGPASGGAGSLAQGEMVREIDDANIGNRWLLMRNDEAPGGPGRMVLVEARQRVFSGAPLWAAKTGEQARLLPAIRAGDRVTVEEHTAVVDAVLEARALSPAAVGSAFDARLAIGGRVVRAVALGPGRAALQPETGVRP